LYWIGYHQKLVILFFNLQPKLKRKSADADWKGKNKLSKRKFCKNDKQEEKS